MQKQAQVLAVKLAAVQVVKNRALVLAVKSAVVQAVQNQAQA